MAPPPNIPNKPTMPPNPLKSATPVHLTSPEAPRWKQPASQQTQVQTPLGIQTPLWQTRAVVLHAAPSKYKPGLMRRWIEEDNDTQILGIRWLLGEHRRIGKLASSLVIYLACDIDIICGTLRMGRRCFRISEYDWDRPSGARTRKAASLLAVMERLANSNGAGGMNEEVAAAAAAAVTHNTDHGAYLGTLAMAENEKTDKAACESALGRIAGSPQTATTAGIKGAAKARRKDICPRHSQQRQDRS
ncbi:hypothetical protein EV426DRAFT_720182 [Tirmania nivea]|nr:hypothetical protein EV426DRAFT_720182 [Tirmania nivea]